MTTKTIIPKSALEKRYEEAKEHFNYEYDNSKYDLYEKDYYIGNGYTGWDKIADEVKEIEEKIAKSYTEDADPEDWEDIRRDRNDQLDYVSEIYETAMKMVRADNYRYQDIESEVKYNFENMLDELHHNDTIDMEVELSDEIVDTKVEYYLTDNTVDVKGDYYNEPYTEGAVKIEYTITVFDEDGEQEQTIEGKFEI